MLLPRCDGADVAGAHAAHADPGDVQFLAGRRLAAAGHGTARHDGNGGHSRPRRADELTTREPGSVLRGHGKALLGVVGDSEVKKPSDVLDLDLRRSRRPGQGVDDRGDGRIVGRAGARAWFANCSTAAARCWRA